MKKTRLGNKNDKDNKNIKSIKKKLYPSSDQVLIADEFNKYFSVVGLIKVEGLPQEYKSFTKFPHPPSLNTFASLSVPTNPVSVEFTEELEKLKNKTIPIYEKLKKRTVELQI